MPAASKIGAPLIASIALAVTTAEAVDLRSAPEALGAGWSFEKSDPDESILLCTAEKCGGAAMVALSALETPLSVSQGIVKNPAGALSGFKIGFESKLRSGRCVFLSYRLVDVKASRVTMEGEGECFENFAVISNITSISDPKSYGVLVITPSAKFASMVRQQLTTWLYKSIDSAP